MTAEDPAVAIVRVETRLEDIEKQLTQMRSEMATKEGQQGAMELIVRIERALAAEVEARIKADADEKAEREKVAARLQLVEDRLEARKYSVLAAVILGAVGLAYGVIQTIVTGLIGGPTP